MNFSNATISALYLMVYFCVFSYILPFFCIYVFLDFSLSSYYAFAVVILYFLF